MTTNTEKRRARFEALEEAYAQVVELCQSYGNPLPLASIERYKAVLSKARGEG